MTGAKKLDKEREMVTGHAIQQVQMIINALLKLKNTSSQQIVKILCLYPKPDGVLFTKSGLLKFAKQMLKV